MKVFYKTMRYFRSYQLYLTILLIVLVNAVGLFFPVLRNDDPSLYAGIAKNMVLNHDWFNLMHNHSDWLDKPHFPFWVTALSFKIFGVNSFAYVMPGFLFHLIGAYYTYLLANKLYNEDIGLISVVIYLSSFHLMLSAIDVRAEAYLLGTMVPACYYWFLYNEKQGIKFNPLILGSFFTAFAIMSKGIFILVPITSGLITLWYYTNRLKDLFSPKWLLALFLSLILIAPELIALYCQFDLHPDKIIFGKTHVSGIGWFFWDSQFGRFFNSGSIVHKGNESWDHYLFFIHTFLWSFLPWTLVGVLVIYSGMKSLFGKTISNHEDKVWVYYLLGSFFPTFILFSITKFQLDHYINILLPFIAILCANWFYQQAMTDRQRQSKLLHIQIWLSFILTLMVIILSVLIFGRGWILTVSIVGLVIFILFIIFIHQGMVAKAIIYPVFAISLVFIFVTIINGKINAKYDVGYQAAKYLNQQQLQPVIDYRVNSLTLEFHAKARYYQINQLTDLKKYNLKTYYLVINAKDLAEIKHDLNHDNIEVLTSIQGTTIDKVMANLLSKPRLNQHLTKFLILKVY